MTIDKLKAGERFKLPLSGKTGWVWETGNAVCVRWDESKDGKKHYRLEIISSKTEVEKL